jgi:hypothetical protein
MTATLIGRNRGKMLFFCFRTKRMYAKKSIIIKMDWPHQLFLHRKNIHKLDLVYHPDKGGDSNTFIEFDKLRKKLQAWDKHWYKLVFSRNDVDAILHDKLNPQYQYHLKNQRKVWSKKLTLSMILNHISLEFEIVKKVWDKQRIQHFQDESWNSEHWFPIFVPHVHANCYGFTISTLQEYLQVVKQDLTTLKLNLQSGDNNSKFYKPSYCDLSIDECLDADFDWLSVLQIPSISKWLLKPNKWSLLIFKPRTPLEKYEFDKLKNSHICDSMCKWNEENRKSNRIRLIQCKKITDNGLKVYTAVYNWLHMHYCGKWVPRSKIVKALDFLPKFSRCELKKMYNFKATFCKVTENSRGLLMKRHNRLIQFKAN